MVFGFCVDYEREFDRESKGFLDGIFRRVRFADTLLLFVSSLLHWRFVARAVYSSLD
jgi:hypothetical protein